MAKPRHQRRKNDEVVFYDKKLLQEQKKMQTKLDALKKAQAAYEQMRKDLLKDVCEQLGEKIIAHWNLSTKEEVDAWYTKATQAIPVTLPKISAEEALERAEKEEAEQKKAEEQQNSTSNQEENHQEDHSNSSTSQLN